MGINIDINTLVGKMQEVAKEIDKQGDKNGLINDEELSIFNGECNRLIAQGVVTAQEVDQIFGLERSEGAKEVSSQATTTPQEFSKKDMKRKGNGVKDAVKVMTKANVEPEKIIASLKERFTSGEYQPIIAEVEAVYNSVKATNYNSKEDVEKIHDTVKKELKSAKKWDDFHKDILGYLEDAAKNDQVNKEFKVLVGMYNDVKDACNNENLAQNFEEYYKVVAGELEKKGADGKKLIDKSYNKEALKMLKDYVEKDAKMLVRARLADETDGESKRAIRKELREAAGDDNIQKAVIQDIKTERKIFARKHKVEHKTEELSHVSKDELRKQLAEMGNQYNFAKKIFSRKTIANDILEKLERSYLEKVKNEDGTYDLSKLSDAILSRTGADYKVNQSTDDKMAEVKKIQEHLKEVTGEDFSDNETGVLVNLFDFKRGHVNRTPKILKPIVGGISSGAAAYGATSKVDVKQLVQIKLYSKSALDDMLKQLSEQNIRPTVTELTEGKFGITILQEYLRDTRVSDVLKGAGIGVLASALMDVAFGEKVDEKSCMSISDYDINDPTYTEAEKYKAHVAKIFSKAPEKVEALQKLVDVYHDEYGNDWDIHFQQALRDIAGIGSKLNPEECLMIRYQKDKAPAASQTPVSTISVTIAPIQQQPVTQPVQENKCDVVTRENIKLDGTNGKPNSAKFYWDELINMYYSNCLKENGGSHTMKEIRFQLRKVNNIPNNYPTVPQGIVLPYDLFGDGSCERTNMQDVTLRKRVKPNTNTVQVIQMQDGGWNFGTRCPQADGSYGEVSWDTTRYATKEEAERAGKEAIGE